MCAYTWGCGDKGGVGAFLQSASLSSGKGGVGAFLQPASLSFATSTCTTLQDGHMNKEHERANPSYDSEQTLQSIVFFVCKLYRVTVFISVGVSACWWLSVCMIMHAWKIVTCISSFCKGTIGGCGSSMGLGIRGTSIASWGSNRGACNTCTCMDIYTLELERVTVFWFVCIYIYGVYCPICIYI